jgi:asparagine synthase (glutamine-hydrolysing)
MCGIFCYFGYDYTDKKLIELGQHISHRGPDSTTNKRINEKLFFIFHRLAINGLNPESDQPLINNGIYLICNGEIFNYKKLIDLFYLHDEYKTGSDCEIIIHLYKLHGIEKTCQLLDGEFAFVLYDSEKDILYSARDQLGIRSLYWNNDTNSFFANNEIFFCSELKGFPKSTKKVQQFPICSYWSSDTNQIVEYHSIYKSFSELEEVEDTEEIEETEEEIIQKIRTLFIEAVEKRLMSERKLACLLSGGLDSTTVSAIVASYYEPYTLSTYSIGLKGSVDLHYAKIAADYFKTNHTSIELTKEEFLGAIEKTIQQIESYDTTTVRASVGNYLVSLFIKEHSDNTVIFCGDVSDEIFGSYRGFYYAENDEDFYNENVTMLENIQYFDVLRSDKSISGAGLEARVPFSDIHFLRYCMSIHPRFKRFSKEKMEKYLFRKAFEDMLPSELAWRVKTAFSDGVSNSETPWYQIIKDYMDTKYTDEEFEEKRCKYYHNMPYDKESLYYREIFEQFYPNRETTIPYFWKQPFMTDLDPSAWLVEKNKEK